MVLSGFRNFFGGLGAAVGNGRESRPEDVAKVKDAMRGLGRYSAERDGSPDSVLDRDLDRAIRGYQADRGLKRDGWMAPKGETAREIGTDLGLLHLASTPGLTPKNAENIMRSRAQLFEDFAWLGNKLGVGDGGFSRAEDYLKHYLGRSGVRRSLASKEVDAEPALLSAERANRNLIEARTFTGMTDDLDLNKQLRDLPDRGPAEDFNDHFETKLSLFDHLRRPGTYFSLGQNGVRTGINGKIKRVGDQVAFDGWATHQLDNRSRNENERGRFGETYNFNPGQPGHAEARVLESTGRARPFDIDYMRKQSLTAIMRRGCDGGLTVERVIWGDPQ